MINSPIAIITGGAGFIGSHMVDNLLERGYNVRVIDNLISGHESNLSHLTHNSKLTLDTRDIVNIPSTDTIYKSVNRIIHFAGIGDIVPSIERPMDYISTNVLGTVAALEGAREAKVNKFVYAASSSCYGLAETPTREDHPIQPQYPYALSKYQGEQATFHWHKVYKLPANVIRIFNAYGPRVRTTGAYGAVFGVFLKQKLSGKPFTVVGDGNQTRDFLHVTDVAEAFRLAAETDRVGRIYNLGTGNPQSLNRLVELLEGEVIFIPKRPGEPDCTWADITRIRLELGWAPTVTFEVGVAEMVKKIDLWHDAPLWDADSIEKATQTWFDSLS